MAYNELKNTSAIWIPKIPKHWDLIKVRHLFKESSIKGFPNEPLLVASQKHGVVNKDVYGQRTMEATKDFHNLKFVEKGDFVISLRSFQGGIEYAHQRGIISPAYTILKELKPINKRYFKHLFKSKPFISLMTLCVKGIRDGQNIDFPTFKGEFLPVPPIQEQEAIGAYLDKKTKKIKEFIKKKERLIELLEEEKVNNYEICTRIGLLENTELKDVNVDWVGQINANWEFRKISHSFLKIGSGTTPRSGNLEYHNYGTEPWVNTGDLNDERLSVVKNLITIKARRENPTLKKYPKETLLIAMYGATIGKVAILDIEACTNQACCALVSHKHFLQEYIFYWFKGNRNKIISLSYGGGQPNISQDVIKALRVPKPAIEEQNQIVKYIKGFDSKINYAISKAKSEIEKTKEYQESLITQIVTGQLKVPITTKEKVNH